MNSRSSFYTIGISLKESIGLVLLAFNSIFAVFLYVLDTEISIGPAVAVAAASCVISLYINKGNFVFFYRALIISWVGLIPALALYQGGYFALRMPYVQTDRVGWIFGLITALSLFSSQVGFVLAKKIRYRRYPVYDFKDGGRITFYACCVLLVIVGLLIAEQRGQMLWFASYASDDQDKQKMPVQNLQAIAGVLVAFLFLLSARFLNYKRTLINLMRNRLFLTTALLVLYIAFWSQLFRGARMDPVGLFIMLFVLYKTVRGEEPALNIRYFLLGILGVIFLQIWGFLRIRLSTGMDISELFEMFLSKDSKTIGSVPVLYFQGTFNNISVGVAGVINAVDNDLVDLWYGKSYLDFIARIPPGIIYPNRPESLAWFSQWIYNDSSGGGMNEMGEVYLNFGFWGSLFIPGIISFIIAASYFRMRYNPLNLQACLPFVGIMAVYTRGLLYQTFDAFKSYITALIIFGCLVVLYNLVISIRSFRYKF